MNPLTLVMAVILAVPTEADIKAFASKAAEAQISRILYAAKTAEYGVYKLEPMKPSTLYLGNRYRVTGYVDSQSRLSGVHLRSDWDAVVRITDSDKLVTLGVTYTNLDGRTELLYEADVKEWCRPEVYESINSEYQDFKWQVITQVKRMPIRSRKKFTNKRIDDYLASVRKKWGLTPSQLAKIIRL
jgi:hypothetical protein